MIPIQKSTINIHLHHFKTTFMCPRSIAGVLFDSVRRFRATLLLHTNCVGSCCNSRASCVAAQQNQNQEPGAIKAQSSRSSPRDSIYLNSSLGAAHSDQGKKKVIE